MKIGFLLCAFNQEEFLSDCLRDLVKFSKENGHVISAVSVPFKEYEDMGVEVDDTTNILRDRLLWRDIDYLVDSPQFISEAEARTLALKPLLEEGCDFIFLIDGDEFYTYKQFNDIVNFLAKDEFISYYRICFKNYVGEGYLKEPLISPRIFRLKVKDKALSSFYFDCDPLYSNEKEKVSYQSLSNKIIPQHLVWVYHLTWMNNEKSKNKIFYQTKHFAHGAGCSYRWDEEKGVVFNEEYYKRTGQSMPKIIVEN